jgi:phage shock protein E
VKKMKIETVGKTFMAVGCLCFVLALPVAAQTNTNVPPPKAAAKTSRRVEVEEFEKLWKDKNNTVLDVRSAKEFAAGHIPGAINLDVNSPDFTQKVGALSKDRVYLVHCAAGVRSARACEKMGSLGFEHLIDLAPGFRAWEKAGKPVEK